MNPVLPRLRECVGVLIEGACIGTAVAALLTARSLFDLLLDDRISGVSAPAVHRFLATEYRGEVVRAALELFALSVTVGAAVGVCAALAWLLCARDGRRSPGVRRAAELGAGCLGCYLWVYAYDVATRPALHQAELFDQGGWRAWLQRGLSDGLGGPGVALLGVLLAGAWLRHLAGASAKPTDAVRSVWLKLRHCRWWALSAATVLATATLIIAFQACTRGSVASQRPNILLIAADSLRPDRLDSRRAPNVARLMERATTFTRTYTPLARTFPAWVSIATGQYPHHHGIRNMFPRWETRERHLDTMAEHLKQAGYRTAVVGDFAADIFRRIELGYEQVVTPTFTMRELVREHLLKNDPWLLAWMRGSFMRRLYPPIVEMHEATDPMAVTDDALKLIERSPDHPFFVTVFYSTTHFPYAAPGPYHRRFAVPGYSGPYRYAKADTLNVSEQLTNADIAQVRGLYDGAVYATDVAIGALLDGLAQRGLAENTIVAITADHGEQLYEYARSQGHGDHLYGNEALQVPMVIAAPGQSKAVRVEQAVSLVDLAPTLLALARVPPLASSDGRSLADVSVGERIEPKPVYSETGLWFTEVIAEVPLSQRIPYPDLTRLTEVDRKHGDQIVIRPQWQSVTTAAKHRMLQVGNWRLIYMPTRSGPMFLLCDLASDPGCLKDASHEQTARFSELKTQLWQLVSDDPEVVRQGNVLQPLTGAGATVGPGVP
jgi:hypothetical protein